MADSALSDCIKVLGEALGHTPRFLVGKPGLDGYSNGAEQIALRAQKAGFDVIYRGIRQTPEEIAELALTENADFLGLSILSGSHMVLVQAVKDALAEHNLGHLPVIIGGIIPYKDATALKEMGVSAVFTPKDFDLGAILDTVTEMLETRYLRRNEPLEVE